MTARQYFHLLALSQGPKAAGCDDLHQSVFETLAKKQMCEARQGMRGPIIWTITPAGTALLRKTYGDRLMPETKDTLDLTYVPITGPGVDALENRKESNFEGVTEEQVNADMRRYMDSGKMRKHAEALADTLAAVRAKLS